MADALNGVSEPLTIISNIIEGICHKFQKFRRVQISHVKRLDNRPAHILAQNVKNVASYVI